MVSLGRRPGGVIRGGGRVLSLGRRPGGVIRKGGGWCH